MLLSCIGQRSLSNTGVLESLLNLLDNLLSPLQPQIPVHRCTEGNATLDFISYYKVDFLTQDCMKNTRLDCCYVDFCWLDEHVISTGLYPLSEEEVGGI